MGSYASYMDSQYEQLKLAFSELEEANRLNKEVNNDLLAACEMALDAQQLSADEYECRYYPEAGPKCLIRVLESAIAKANQPASLTDTSKE